MGKLQEIIRKNKSKIYLVYVPKNVVESAGFKKGDNLKFIVSVNQISINKGE